jgi:type II secretory pathway predicted ATPase ExeA
MLTSAINNEPFPCTGLDNYFFATPALRLRLDLIREYVHRKETPVLILGETGVGKSALLNQLVCRADANWRIVRMPAVHSFSTTDVVTFLNSELRLPMRGPARSILKEFDNWLDRLDMCGQTAVIVIDNAHDLCDESLVRLATLREDVRSQNICVVMTGEPGLRSRMSDLLGSSHSQFPMRAINIPSLDQREVAAYIDMRLYHAGLEGKGPFNRATIDEIARSSRGYPGRINQLANGLLYGEHRIIHWQSASRRIRRIMRHWRLAR